MGRPTSRCRIAALAGNTGRPSPGSGSLHIHRDIRLFRHGGSSQGAELMDFTPLHDQNAPGPG